ncbi:MAG: NAD-dependent epimerase/dehydratase family protein [Candidatus Ratteibacteria bacterium]|jgi:dTDP-L-rhamnose 4-epimerase
MKKILITGGAGFIGSHLVDSLIKKGYRTTVYDNLDPQVHQEGIPRYLNPKTAFIHGDIRDASCLYDAIAEQDAIFHFASAVGVGQSQYKISHYTGVNTFGTSVLLDLLANKKHHVKKVIVASSMSIYGEGLYLCETCGTIKPPLREIRRGKKETSAFWEPKCPHCTKPLMPIPTTEQTTLQPNSVYAFGKRHQEELSLLIGKTYGIPVVALRFFNVYGPRQNLSNPYTGVCAIFLSRIKNNQPPIIYEDGNQTRDFIWIDDIVRANLLALENKELKNEIINIGSGTPVRIKDIALLLAEQLHKKISPNISFSFRKGDVRHCFADIKKAKTLLGFTPRVSLQEGLSILGEWSETIEASDRFLQAEKEIKEKKLVV